MAAKIVVEGFKSIGQRVEVEVRPLTLLAGANSSGKSTLMQSLLLLKQTLEANFDPGPLLLNGPNVRFTSADQLLHTELGAERANGFSVGVELEEFAFETRLERKNAKADLDVVSCRFRMPGSREHELAREGNGAVSRPASIKRDHRELIRERFWLQPATVLMLKNGPMTWPTQIPSPASQSVSVFRDMIHVPGLRGNPERSYPITACGPRFPGTFESYTASVIQKWMAAEPAKLAMLGDQLKRLGLTWKVETKKLDDATIELRVGRLPEPVRHGARDLVNIADVGFGVSQALPVLVALLEARPGQIVYIEQPEIHLHPKAQVAMAGILADAARREVLVVAETHSALLLLGVQTLTAQGELDPSLAKLHWFQRDRKTGATSITSRDLDTAGRFGDWPEDFDDVALEAQSRYLDAVDAALAKER